ncbi:enoyl-CoA hydratase [Arthrobacter sp. MYb227]|uniref:enoyl-CoA hydratase/isomerase family protein n=1 Tax=Arthrobacter sp. MYb227 TaxID=1848601 RepID=UPI000CFB4005|nr:enoyl-CoA hydratase/isomerase family protein [Arthrobacter sp. MYb227]PQZ94572.1 enoyl-CoA hydratase [Arthrobacter sp. MYb227]
MPSIKTVNDVAILDLGAGENRFTPAWLEEVDQLLDWLLLDPPRALVTTGSGKFYSNGLDVDESQVTTELEAGYVYQIHRLFRRILALPMPTVAAINGHAFGGGALLAMAHDYRIMREDRGYFCFPEVNIGIPFTPGMAALIQCKLDPRSARDAMLTGRRTGGAESVQAGLVDAAVDAGSLLAHATALAITHVPAHPGTLGTVKSVMYADALSALQLPHRQQTPQLRVLS